MHKLLDGATANGAGTSVGLIPDVIEANRTIAVRGTFGGATVALQVSPTRDEADFETIWSSDGTGLKTENITIRGEFFVRGFVSGATGTTVVRLYLGGN